jgi:hypothetical protein
MQAIHKKQLVVLAVLAFLNLLFGNLVDTGGERLSGEAVLAHSPEMRRALFSTVIFGLQFFGFLLGALVALVPYRQKPYGEKLLTFGLGLSVGFQALALLAALFKLLFWK